MVNTEHLALAAVLSYILMQFVQAVLKPFFKIVNKKLKGEEVKKDVLDLWPMYATALVAGGTGWFARLNILPGLEHEILGRVITALGIGLGPSFLYDLTHREEEEEEDNEA